MDSGPWVFASMIRMMTVATQLSTEDSGHGGEAINLDEIDRLIRTERTR